MAAIIPDAIPPRAFEIIRDRIARILADEIPSQATLKSDPDLALINEIFVERFVPFDHTEVPAVNVSLSNGDYDNFTQIDQTGTYIFNVDVYANSNTIGSEESG